jgi:PTH1 family peptidyl-tRNA hydrolase
MKLLVGLGNPGGAYARHRHNVGFMAVERIAERHGLGPWRRRFQGLTAEGVIDGHRVVLFKPQVFMNESGRSVGEAKRYLKISERDVCVFHDELDLAPGKVRAKVGGGNAGHNGLRSLTAHIGNDFARVRIGIGHPGSKERVQAYVLHDFSKADAVWLKPLIEAIADAAGRLAAGDEARFLAEVSRGLSGAPKKAAKKEGEPTPLAAAPGGSAQERSRKRLGALADNLKRWLKGPARQG